MHAGDAVPLELQSVLRRRVLGSKLDKLGQASAGDEGEWLIVRCRIGADRKQEDFSASAGVQILEL